MAEVFRRPYVSRSLVSSSTTLASSLNPIWFTCMSPPYSPTEKLASSHLLIGVILEPDMVHLYETRRPCSPGSRFLLLGFPSLTPTWVFPSPLISNTVLARCQRSALASTSCRSWRRTSALCRLHGFQRLNSHPQSR